MNVPDTTFWGGVVTILGAIGSWAVTVERRLGARLTRKEHTEICEKSSAVRDQKLEKIITTLEKQTENTLMHRQWMGDSIAHIRTQIAVIRDRMSIGNDPLRDEGTGSFRRGDR